MIKAILAVTKDGGIGNNGTLPWPKNSEDLKWFKKHTTGQVVVMGRNTWDDPLMPKPLPNRINYVATSRPLEGLDKFIARTFSGPVKENVIRLRALFDQDVFIIGGASLYAECVDLVDEIYLTTVAGDYETDTKIDLTKFLNGFTLIYKELTRSNTYEIWRRNFRESL